MPRSSTVQSRDFGHLPSQKHRSLYSEAIQTSSIEALNNKDSFIFLNLYKQRASAGAVRIKTKQKTTTAPVHGQYHRAGHKLSNKYCSALFSIFFLRRKKKVYLLESEIALCS